MMIRVLLAAALITVPVAQSAARPPVGEAETMRESRLRRLPVELQGGQFEIFKQVQIRTGPTVIEASFRDGVYRRDEDRLALSALPVVGPLFKDRILQDDVTRDTWAGDVYAVGDTLVVDMPDLPGDTRFEHMAVLNRSDSYHMAPSHRVIETNANISPPGSWQHIGSAHVRPQDGTLIVVLPPTIVTSTPLPT